MARQDEEPIWRPFNAKLVDYYQRSGLPDFYQLFPLGKWQDLPMLLLKPPAEKYFAANDA